MFKNIILLAMLYGTLQCAEAMEYHGFQIDESMLQEANRAHALEVAGPSIVDQINLVESAGLPPGILDSFRRTKIFLDPSPVYTLEAFFPKREEQGSVRIPVARIPATTPALLLGLMRAYQFNVLGWDHPEINKAFRNAREETDYPPGFLSANFLQTPQTFFSVTATLYLLGRLTQPPFDCNILSSSDPQYLLFLSDTFGRPGCDPKSPALASAHDVSTPPVSLNGLVGLTGANTNNPRPQLTVLHRSPLVYPESARKNHEEGVVTARVQIDESGLVKTVNVTTSSGSIALDQAAEDSISKSTFQPYILNGKPAPVSVLMHIKFALAKGKNP